MPFHLCKRKEMHRPYCALESVWGDGSYEKAKKVRLWCSEKDDHCGSISSWTGKDRMEFYPDRLPDEIRTKVFGE